MKKHVLVLAASAFVLTFGGIGASAEEKAPVCVVTRVTP